MVTEGSKDVCQDKICFGVRIYYISRMPKPFRLVDTVVDKSPLLRGRSEGLRVAKRTGGAGNNQEYQKGQESLARPDSMALNLNRYSSGNDLVWLC